jgi:hypothetical protein
MFPPPKNSWQSAGSTASNDLYLRKSPFIPSSRIDFRQQRGRRVALRQRGYFDAYHEEMKIVLLAVMLAA